MPPTESQILSTFLLPPANIRSFISLSNFVKLFPQPLRKNPQIVYLYRELQHQRGLIIDQIEKNIATEVRAGEKQRREVIKARRRDEHEEMGLVGANDQNELDMEVEVRARITIIALEPPHYN
jgi:centromere-localized protein 2